MVVHSLPDDPSDVKVTYLGHASLLLESRGESILTDPVFSSRIGKVFTRRRSRPTFRPEELRGIVGVLISHGHHDHLDYRSLARIGKSHPIVVPWGIAGPMRLRGFADVRVTRPWQELTLGHWKVTTVPSRHFGGRLPLVGTSGYQGYVLSGPSSCIYFAGDTGLDEPMFRAIAQRFKVGLAILPIAGAVFPWYRRNHMNAEDALRAFGWLEAERMLPIHYETYPASFEGAGEARRRLVEASAGIADRVSILAEGASLHFRSGRPVVLSVPSRGTIAPSIPSAA
jgi:L-ascorbate metabolism protein UlaG (beta-lactamase superfamily)